MPVDLEWHGGTAAITINQPESLNTLNPERLEQILQRIDEVNANTDARAIVLTGAGEKAFIAGADIKAMVTFTKADAREFGELGHRVARALETSSVPVIAAINGYAFGGGCELALACDIRIASSNALLAQPEVGLGIPPGWGGTQRLKRVIGPGMAAKMILSGRRINAEEALRIGLVDEVVVPGEALKTALDLAAEIGKQGPQAVRASKRLLALDQDQSYLDALAEEAGVFAESFETPEQVEGMTAFVEKRAPDYGGTSDA